MSSTPVTNAGPSRFKTSVLLAAMLFAPAAFLVMRGNLSINEALVRFGCALVFAMVGTAVVISTMPSPAGRGDGEPAPGLGEQSAAAPVTEATTSIGVPVAQPAS